MTTDNKDAADGAAPCHEKGEYFRDLAEFQPDYFDVLAVKRGQAA